MESLNTLASSLPNANNLANSEKDLLNNFKAAALSITTLYRSSRQTSKRAYNAGYGAACQDLLLMIQQGVSVGGAADPSSSNSGSMNNDVGNGMTIGKVMDWIEARLEAIKSREEEEDEDEEKERARNGSHTTTAPAAKPNAPKEKTHSETVASTSRHKEQQPIALPLTPHSPTAAHAYIPQPSSPPPSPSPPSTPLYTNRPTHHLPKGTKSRVAFPAIPLSDAYKFGTGAPTGSAGGEDGYGLGAGAKRRHAVMMMLDSASSPVDLSISAESSPGNAGTSAGSGSSAITGGRRRTRSMRTHGHGHAGGNQQSAEAMDVEEDGRERKRVTRR